MYRSRAVVSALAVSGLFALTACSAPTLDSPASVSASQGLPSMPSSPVTINVIDVGGALALTQNSIQRYAKENPKLVTNVTFTKAPAPELAGKIKAEQSAGRLDIDLVLTGVDGLSSGQAQDIWQPVLPGYAAKFPGLVDNYLPGAAKMQELAKGQAICVTYSPGGPLLEFMPGTVTTPPQSPAALLDWAKAHPGKFEYAQPSNSGPGRTFLMGLPYLLGDKDPKDPLNGWDKTWAYLQELGQYIDYYPAGTSVTMTELGQGTRFIVPAQMGWYVNPRVLGTVPQQAQVTTMDGFHFVTDAHYMAIPKGITADKLAVVLDLEAYLLQPAQQAETYDSGYFFPGPSVKNVPLSAAPARSQELLGKFGDPAFDQLIAGTPTEVPLSGTTLTDAFAKWDREIGSGKVKKS